ncbi:peptidoglycan DD-metalloendopeptidase family protein [Chengkuizengella axinellae]|uniref:Peptidoglycan DD-metalloendopeptidase family protein n=1 Tax=Chengkuizengella axinellae TaxID=3064388 RepID=A0ABT9J360_9BACL|nr:peptidoglycan DD-metalloendopeptidase family protein [Chengkuizengella sp. 2205SS18-9]MDP5276054.1 peptidoglycan DD-metalloendopeptidase family protein [Chengkuizengella sp. 2205SS18-9]
MKLKLGRNKESGPELDRKSNHRIQDVVSIAKNEVNNLHFWLIAIVVAALLISISIASIYFYIHKNTNQIYHVYFGEEKVGTVVDQQKIKDLIADTQDKLNQQNPDFEVKLNDEQFSFKRESGYKLESNDEEALAQVSRRLESHIVGIELVVNGEIIAIVKDEETAQQILDKIKNKYVPEERVEGEAAILSDDAKSADETKQESTLKEVNFNEEVELKQVETQPEEIAKPESVVTSLETGDVVLDKYIVEEGDCITCIAQKLDIPSYVIYENNQLSEDSILNIGDELNVTVLKPTLSVETIEEVVEERDIHFDTEYIVDDTLKLGKNEVITPGKPGRIEVVYEVVKLDGRVQEERKKVISETILLEPVTKVVKKGSKVVPGEGTGNFRWPLVSPSITSYYGYRWGSLHAALDMVSGNRKILASDTGKVIYAGYSGSYGNNIIIDHQNGYKTLYAHLQSIHVSVGMNVERGEQIGVMGSTGNSTGPHLHFEIIKNGVQQNPLVYLN